MLSTTAYEPMKIVPSSHKLWFLTLTTCNFACATSDRGPLTALAHSSPSFLPVVEVVAPSLPRSFHDCKHNPEAEGSYHQPTCSHGTHTLVLSFLFAPSASHRHTRSNLNYPPLYTPSSTIETSTYPRSFHTPYITLLEVLIDHHL